MGLRDGKIDDALEAPPVVTGLVEEDVGWMDYAEVGVVVASVEVDAEPGGDAADEGSRGGEAVKDFLVEADDFDVWDVFFDVAAADISYVST